MITSFWPSRHYSWRLSSRPFLWPLGPQGQWWARRPRNSQENLREDRQPLGTGHWSSRNLGYVLWAYRPWRRQDSLRWFPASLTFVSRPELSWKQRSSGPQRIEILTIELEAISSWHRQQRPCRQCQDASSDDLFILLFFDGWGQTARSPKKREM